MKLSEGFYSVLLLIVYFSTLSCEKKSDDIETIIEGRAIDFRTSMPIAGIKILIGAGNYQGSAGGRKLAMETYIDSFYTDSNGDYKLSFKTQSKFAGYEMRYVLPQNYYDGNSSNSYQINIGKTNTINLSFQKMAFLKLSLNIIDNPNPPLNVGTLASNAQVFADSTFFLTARYNSETLHFSIQNKDTPSIYNVFDTTISIANEDTFYQTIVVYPSLFSKRK